MKYLPLVALSTIIAFGQSTPRTVYILPMAGGLDQYLADLLTRRNVLQVVTDPKLADTVLTDRLDAVLEQKLAEFHPATDKKSDSTPPNTFRSNRKRGTIFLVNVKSRDVTWSDYEEVPDSNSNDHLYQEAQRIVKKLQASPSNVFRRPTAPPSASASPIAPTPSSK
jgi:hypothetical protein